VWHILSYVIHYVADLVVSSQSFPPHTSESCEFRFNFSDIFLHRGFLRCICLSMTVYCFDTVSWVMGTAISAAASCTAT